MAEVIVIASCIVFTAAIIAIFRYSGYIISMQINRNPCKYVASNIKTCIAIRKPALKNHACIHAAEGSNIKVLLQVSILMFHGL